MRGVLVTILLLHSFPVLAEVWTALGSAELGPAPGNRTHLRAAASRDGSLAAWWDTRAQRQELYAARLDAAGQVIDRTGILIGRAAAAGPIAVGSDGESYLVAWTAEKKLWATRILADGTFTTRELGPAVWPESLAWDGERYGFFFRTDRTAEAMLLDSDGQAVSGTLRLLPYHPHRLQMVSAKRGSWFGAGLYRTFAVDLEMFPPAGTTGTVALETRYSTNAIEAAADGSGYYSIASASTPAGDAALIILRRYTFDGRPLLGPRTFRVPRHTSAQRTVAAGGAIYVLCRVSRFGGADWPVYRLERSEAVPVRGLGAPAQLENAHAFVAAPSGPMLFWSDRRNLPGPTSWTGAEPRDEFYAATAGSEEWLRGGTLLSAAPPRGMVPAIAAGNASYLAAWIEQSDRHSVAVSVLDRDARPVTPPLTLGSDVFMDDILVAFDGVHYLVVWSGGRLHAGFQTVQDARTLGRFVTQDGAPAGPAFPIATHRDTRPLASLLWTGKEYLLTSKSGAHRINTAGVVTALAYDFPEICVLPVLWLAPDGDGGYTGLGVSIDVSVVAAGPLYLSVYRRIRLDGELTPRHFDRTYLILDDYGWWDIAPGVAPEVAIAGTHYYKTLYLITADALTILPYKAPEARRLQILRTPRALVIAAGPNLARHGLDGSLAELRSLGADVAESAIVAEGSSAVIVLRQRHAAPSVVEAARIGL